MISAERGFAATASEDAAWEPVPTYCMIGEGDIPFMVGTPWDDEATMTDAWIEYFLDANGVGPLGDGSNYTVAGRFTTYTWDNAQDFPLFQCRFNEKYHCAASPESADTVE